MNILYFTLVKVKYSIFICVLLNEVTIGCFVRSSTRSFIQSSAYRGSIQQLYVRRFAYDGFTTEALYKNFI